MAQLIISSYPLPFSMLPPGGIDCNNWAIALDKNWREIKREEERLRGRKDNRTPAPR